MLRCKFELDCSAAWKAGARSSSSAAAGHFDSGRGGVDPSALPGSS